MIRLGVSHGIKGDNHRDDSFGNICQWFLELDMSLGCSAHSTSVEHGLHRGGPRESSALIVKQNVFNHKGAHHLTSVDHRRANHLSADSPSHPPLALGDNGGVQVGSVNVPVKGIAGDW